MPTPIVLVPGLLCSAEVFAHQVGALWPYGPVTVANTLFGTTLPEIAESILANTPPKFALAGISMGGYLSLEIVRQAPDRVLKLALLDTSARPDGPDQPAQRRAMVAKAREGDFDTFAVAALTSLLHPAHRDDPAIREINLRMGQRVGIEGFARQTEAVIARVDSRPLLPQIRVPTLVLVGDSDAVTPLECAEEMASAIPDSRLVVIPESGHSSTLEQPERVSNALVKWLVGQG